MDQNSQSKEQALEALRDEIAALLCSDSVSEEEKALRLEIAQHIIESQG